MPEDNIPEQKAPDGSKEITDKVKSKRRITSKDFDFITEYIMSLWETRKEERKPFREQWDEIDRQVKMDPDVKFKIKADGTTDKNKTWMPEMELPLQAMTLEINTADARRLLFPGIDAWFVAHSEVSDDYLKRVEEFQRTEGLIAGDENKVLSEIRQNDVDDMVSGWLTHFHRQYPFQEHIDRCNADAIKYGLGIGRLRAVNKRIAMQTNNGVVIKDQRIPVFFPRSIRNVYPDSSMSNLMNEGFIVAPSYIADKVQSLVDMQMAANAGGTDPRSQNGGWIMQSIKALHAADVGEVTLVELEGDVTVPRKSTGSVYLPNCIMTIATGKEGKGGKTMSKLVRYQVKEFEWSSYIEFPYHYENVNTAYPTSPLMKGRPIQSAANEALNRLMQTAILNAEPPVQWDRTDVKLASTGGPVIEPGRKWGSLSDIKVVSIGDPKALAVVYELLLKQYADVTGTQPSRLGERTRSHTTGFAKAAELEQGTIRVVDYVNSLKQGPLVTLLSNEYRMAKQITDKKIQQVYVDEMNGFVNLSKQAVPDNVVFEVFGSGTPLEQLQKDQKKLQAIMFSMQVDQVKVQLGIGEPLNYEAIQQEVLRDGGVNDPSRFAPTSTRPAGPATAGPGVSGIPNDSGARAAVPSAIQAVAPSGQQ